jgi:hypothetical protein
MIAIEIMIAIESSAMILGMLGKAEEVLQKKAATYFPAWETDELPKAPKVGWKSWTALIGPGIVLAGANIGGGEWLFGPIVTARYGGQLMWLATLSIGFQVFYNLAIMRYTLYTGEPVMVGFLRTWPGPKFWAVFYLMADMGGIWPYLASNAACLWRRPSWGDYRGRKTTRLFERSGMSFFSARPCR